MHQAASTTKINPDISINSQYLQGMQIVVLALIRSIPPISSVAMFGLFEFIIFAIIGIQLFSGRLGACNQVVRPHLYASTTLARDISNSDWLQREC